MSKKLVIVESPAKAKTIKKYLGEGYEVMASMGHVRDLPAKKLSVNVRKHFEPNYEIIEGKEELVQKLEKSAKKADFVYLATDPDREGEAISWHLAYILGLQLDEKNRVEFNEITKTGVQNGMNNPRTINIDLVNAQQARRILDRLVGYKLSPFLSRHIKRGLSAGRVQSVAVKLILDREQQINEFQPEEYWTVDGKFIPKGSKKTFSASLYGTTEGKLKISSEDEARQIVTELENETFTVTKLRNGTRKKQPAPPFTTSTLQQEASRKLNFQSKRTMRVAQELYEGVDIPNMGAVGLITYMRTDSLRISNDAIAEVTQFIEGKWGKSYLPDKPRFFKTKANAQDGHEAIRPTMPSLEPDSIKASLTTDQYKMYKLIWERFTACQMAECVQKTTSVDITGGKYVFKATGYRTEFDGFTILYVEGQDTEEEKKTELPALEKDMMVKAKEIIPNQHFTQPPARFTEATLIKTMEENGIGRPSTYASTISTITSRGYVKREGKTLFPTELGAVSTQLMQEHFPKIVNVEFTAQMEESLDKVEHGQEQWVKLLDTFYSDFKETLKQAKEDTKDINIKIQDEETDIVCEKCGRKMVIKNGRFGKFIACPGYPECKNVKSLVESIGVKCPKCAGDIVIKKSKRGRIFYGCNNYPECDFVSWTEPTNEKCPNCNGVLYKKKGKVTKLYCTTEGCGFIKDFEEKQ